MSSKQVGKVRNSKKSADVSQLEEVAAESPMDARMVRTDLALRKAFLALLERKTLDEITIREIAAKADVHYATFFRHHTSKESLLDHVAADQVNRLVNLTVPLLEPADSRTAFVTLCSYVYDHRKLWSTLLNGGAAPVVRKEYLRISRNVARYRASKDLLIPVDLAVTCTVSLMLDTLAWWLNQPAKNRFSVEEIAAILDHLVRSFGTK